MKSALLQLSLFALVPCALADEGKTRPGRLPATCEVVMTPGMRITATTPAGKIAITAVDEVTRAYTWDGATRAVEMTPREGRYFGSLGLYHVPAGIDWRSHHGITRCFADEGQLHVESVDKAKKWIQWIEEHEGVSLVYRDDGLMVGWRKGNRMDLDVQVWQFLFDGKKPKQLPGSQNDRIVVEKVETETLPLVKAVAGDDLEAATALLAKGADANAKNSVGFPVLTMAIRRHSAPMVETLLKHGANPNVRDIDTDFTPLLESISYRDLELNDIVKRLLAAGADVNAAIRKQDDLLDGLTPLISAVMDENEELVQLLLDKGADVHARTRQGLDALEWAKLDGGEHNQAVIRKLQAAAAKK